MFISIATFYFFAKAPPYRGAVALQFAAALQFRWVHKVRQSYCSFCLPPRPRRLCTTSCPTSNYKSPNPLPTSSQPLPNPPKPSQTYKIHSGSLAPEACWHWKTCSAHQACTATDLTLHPNLQITCKQILFGFLSEEEDGVAPGKDHCHVEGLCVV